MKTVIEYEKGKEKVLFEEIKDRECFYSGSVLYMKILQPDLEAFNIENINAISIVNAGLTCFTNDEEVYRATKNIEVKRQ